MRSYKIHGLKIYSEIKLKATQDRFKTPDIFLRWNQQKQKPKKPQHEHLLLNRHQAKQALVRKYDNGALSIEYFQCGFFYFHQSTLWVRKTHGDLNFFEAILTTQILPLVSSLFRVTLHGGVVQRGHNAAVYLGAEGAGKSTLTAFLHHSGDTILSDDVASLEPKSLCVHRGLPEIRINEDSCQKINPNYMDPKHKTKLTKKQILLTPRSTPLLPISALFLLTPNNELKTKKVILLNSSQAFENILEHQFRWDLWNPKNLKNEFQTLTSLCERVPVWKLIYPQTYNNLSWIQQQMERRMNGQPEKPHPLRQLPTFAEAHR